MKKILFAFIFYTIALAILSFFCGCSKSNTTSDQTPMVMPPSVTTATLSSISQTTAISGGSVISAGGGSVTARGVCWATTSGPTITSSKTSDGTGTGAFTSALAGLTQNTTYFVRSYATNSAGTAYGNELSFTTLSSGGATIPSLTTTAATSITQTGAQSGGVVITDGGAAITAKGVCWSTSANPTVASSKTMDGSGTATFTSALTGLTANTTYHVRAYGTNSSGTGYGSDVSFTTQASGGGAVTITISGMAFSPSNTTVAKGTTVRWVNNDAVNHTATSDDGSTFNVSVPGGGGSGTFVANTAGTFTYHCNIHPSMTATLVVSP